MYRLDVGGDGMCGDRGDKVVMACCPSSLSSSQMCGFWVHAVVSLNGVPYRVWVFADLLSHFLFQTIQDVVAAMLQCSAVYFSTMFW